MVRYYGHYSNAPRGHRQKKNLDDLIPSILEPISIDDSDSQVPFSTPPFYPGPDYPIHSCLG
jgi:hypothetical protein